MWIYYYASHGPGHQSTDSGFKYFNSSYYDMEGIKEYLFDHNHYWDDPVLEVWEVKKLPDKHIKNRIKDIREKIKNSKEYLKMLEKEDCFSLNEKEGEDLIIKNILKSKVDSDVLRRLHKAGFMYDSSDIDNWWYGKKCPVEPDRSKILRIIRRAKSYPKH